MIPVQHRFQNQQRRFTYVLSVLTALASLPSSQAYSGKATFYDLYPNAPVACEVPVHASEIKYLAALDRGMFDQNRPSSCGKCALVHGPKGSIQVRIVDRCEGCGPNSIDLSREGFPSIANIDDGRVNIQWEFVPCDGRSVTSAAKAEAPKPEPIRLETPNADAKPSVKNATAESGTTKVEPVVAPPMALNCTGDACGPMINPEKGKLAVAARSVDLSSDSSTFVTGRVGFLAALLSIFSVVY